MTKRTLYKRLARILNSHLTTSPSEDRINRVVAEIDKSVRASNLVEVGRGPREAATSVVRRFGELAGKLARPDLSAAASAAGFLTLYGLGSAQTDGIAAGAGSNCPTLLRLIDETAKRIAAKLEEWQDCVHGGDQSSDAVIDVGQIFDDGTDGDDDGLGDISQPIGVEECDYLYEDLEKSFELLDVLQRAFEDECC